MLNISTLNTSKGIVGILLMGGAGTRFGSETPKQFHRLTGKKVYLHTLEVFLKSQLFEEIILVSPPSWIEDINHDLTAYTSSTQLKVISGGTTRQESSLNGLLACQQATKVVVIHDAVRPFLSLEILKENVKKALQYHAVDTCIPSADTLVYAPTKHQISNIPSRADYLRGQTPQSFSYPVILEAHLKAKEAGLNNSSDDCSLVLRQGIPVHIVMGSEENIKITSELDLFLAEQLFRLKCVDSFKGPIQSLAGKRIAVTGGTGGIGREICRLLQEEGALPIIISRSSPHYPADLTSSENTQTIFNKILNDHGPLDGLINSIGILKTLRCDQLSNEEVDVLIATNLNSVIYSCKHAPLKSGAHIINIASSSYSRGRKNYAIYASAKAAVVNFTQGLAEERPDLFINAVVPQRTLTEMRLENFPGEDRATLLHPSDVAKEIIHLLKQQSITGSLIEVKKR